MEGIEIMIAIIGAVVILTGDKLKITEKQYDALNGLEWFHASS